MKLEDLLKTIGLPCPDGLGDQTVLGLATDSRSCKSGDLFIGMPGTKVDGADFALQALAQGAIACVVADSYQSRLAHPQILFSKDIVGDCAKLACAFFDYPSQSMNLLGVTGTNGKTTTTHLIEFLLQTDPEQYAPALLGTLYNRWRNYCQTAVHTTPFAVDLQQQLRQALDAGSRNVVMEVSSHALAQRRVLGCQFAVAVFTNLTQDHLDFHGTMENYFQAKALLFSPEYLQGRAVINYDDPYGRRLSSSLYQQQANARVWTYSIDNPLTDIYVKDLSYQPQGVTGILHTPLGECVLKSGLVGKFNVSNILAAVGAVLELGVPLTSIAEALPKFPSVAGRVERVQVGEMQDITVVVDYAHTPDSLENVLMALRPFTQKRLVCVFGCGGDRDRTKRPIMGAIAERLADFSYITSDNPRTENPQQILDDILTGITNHANTAVISDRRECIHTAIQSAQAGDTVLIAGKGHEDYQIIGTSKIHFDDREEAAIALRQKYSLG